MGGKNDTEGLPKHYNKCLAVKMAFGHEVGYFWHITQNHLTVHSFQLNRTHMSTI